jgi:hypothetical protein
MNVKPSPLGKVPPKGADEVAMYAIPSIINKI